MRILPEQKGKTIFLILVLILVAGGIVYFNFFRNDSASLVNNAVNPPGTNDSIPIRAQGGGGKVTIKKPAPGLLPYGEKIDTSILDNDSFKSLRASAPLTVRPDELGKADPFAK